jgi:hypothetical protein
VRGIGLRRVAAALAVAGAALAAAGTATAGAATHSPRAAMFTPRMLASMAPKGGLLQRMAGLLPGASTVSLENLELFTDPVNVTMNGITYRMTMSADSPPVAFDQPPQLNVELDRTTAAGGLITGEQQHLYGYAPLSGMHFTVNAGLTRATVNTGGSIDPSAVDVHFQSSGPVEQQPCTLVGGGQGVFQVASGTLSATTFKIATATFPFFGTITTVPRTATAIHDPGCATFIGSGSAARAKAARAAPVFHEQCTGNVIEQSSLTSFWLSQLGFGGRRLEQLGITETNPFGPDGISHAVAGLGSGADMPRPVKTARGVRATVLTTGVPFMGGRAVFTSAVKPHVSPGHSCVWERHLHHFTTTRYAGKLTSTGSPLEMMFDTGATPVPSSPAELFIHSYQK